MAVAAFTLSQRSLADRSCLSVGSAIIALSLYSVRAWQAPNLVFKDVDDSEWMRRCSGRGFLDTNSLEALNLTVGDQLDSFWYSLSSDMSL